MTKSNTHILDLRQSAATSAAVRPLPAHAPERLVGVGFRCWLNGLSTGEIENWTDAWNTYESVLGADHAKALLMDLSVFVRAVSAGSRREINVMERGCSGFCQDECLAISIIAASQHGAHTSLAETARTLLGSDDIGDTIMGAERLAGGLTHRRQKLSAHSICPATCALQMMRKSMRRTRH